LDAWDMDMVQGKSKAFVDLEYFPIKFTAAYLLLIVVTNSGIPRVNESCLDRKIELIRSRVY